MQYTNRGRAFKSASILLIDDDKDLAHLLEIGLELKGFNVRTYNDPIDALMNFSPLIYDLVVLDIQMPGMDGFDVYQDLRNIDENVKACFLTEREGQEEVFKKMFPHEPHCEVLQKPLTISTLAEKINEILMFPLRHAKVQVH